MSPGWNLFNSQDSKIASQARISTGRQRAEPPPLDYPHAATGNPDLGVNLPKTAGQKHKKYHRFQVEIGGISSGGFQAVCKTAARRPSLLVGEMSSLGWLAHELTNKLELRHWLNRFARSINLFSKRRIGHRWTRDEKHVPPVVQARRA